MTQTCGCTHEKPFLTCLIFARDETVKSESEESEGWDFETIKRKRESMLAETVKVWHIFR